MAALSLTQTCAIAEHRDVWALGDCAEIPKIDSKGTRAPTAQNATREGELVARNIVAAMRGEAPRAIYVHANRRIGAGRTAFRCCEALWISLFGLSRLGNVAGDLPFEDAGMAQRSRIAIDWLLDFIYGRNVAEFPVDASVIGPRPAEPVHTLGSGTGR